MKGDCVFIYGLLAPPLDDDFRVVIEGLRERSKQNQLIVLLETYGGTMETVERLVAVMRQHYKEVCFVIPNFAYSAGTVLALSGDRIYMDYYSVLGPIDPQYRDGDEPPQPGQGHLAKFEELKATINKSANAQECRAELAYLVRKFNPATLFRIEQSIKHGETLVTQWLPKYKFKNWKVTDKRRKKVTPGMREQRAMQIAQMLGNAEKWHSHGRGITMADLSGPDIQLKIDDLAANVDLANDVKHYHGLTVDHCYRQGSMVGYIHSQLGIRRTR